MPGHLARHRLAWERAAIHRHCSVLTADEEARHMVFARGRLVGRKGKAERLAKAAPGKKDRQIAGSHRLAIGARRIARCFGTVQAAVRHAAETWKTLVGPKERDEIGNQIARQLLIVV